MHRHLFLSSLLVLLLLVCKPSIAQTAGTPSRDTSKVIRICTPSRGKLLAPPLYIVHAHNKTFKVLSFDNINPNMIKSINVLKDSISTWRYGKAGKNGVVEIYLNDEKYPDAYKLLEADSVKLH